MYKKNVWNQVLIILILPFVFNSCSQVQVSIGQRSPSSEVSLSQSCASLVSHIITSQAQIYKLKPASNPSKIKSRNLLITELEMKLKNLKDVEKVIDQEIEVPEPFYMADVLSSLNLNRIKISELEKIEDQLSSSQSGLLKILKLEKIALEARVKYQLAVNNYNIDMNKVIAQLENFSHAASIEEGAVMNQKIHKTREQLSIIFDLEIIMIQAENKILKRTASELEVLSLDLYVKKKKLVLKNSQLSAQLDKAIFEGTLAKRKEYRLRNLGESTDEIQLQIEEAFKKIRQLQSEMEFNSAEIEKLKEQSESSITNDAVALEKMVRILRKNEGAPKGVPYNGYIYRSGVPEIHLGNISANHRYSGPDQGLLYTSANQETVMAELLHYEMNPKDVSPVNSYRVNLENMLDLTNANTRLAMGVDLSSLVRDDYLITHSLGSVARELGYQGIIAPSARLLSGTHILLFDEISIP